MKTASKNLLLLTTLILSSILAQAQPLTQTIRGTVTDAVTKEPLIGATIQVLDLPEVTGTITDLDGLFVLEKIPVGRHSIQCSYVGYEAKSEILLLNSAKEGYLEFKLSQGSTELDAVEVRRPPNDALNPLAVVSMRSIAPEETQYYPAGGNDFGRSVVSLPGIQPSKDNENDVVIRGNSSTGVVWRLEGVDILNPNHFARKGSSSGGITIFSISVLDKSDFSTGAFPAEYGNGLSGVFDLRFRNGNTERREYTFRAGMLGLDLAAEGPFSSRQSGSRQSSSLKRSENTGIASGRKPTGGSYLMNYRYSTLGILNKLGLHLVGERVDNTFQDLSFNLNFPSKNGKSNFNIWGLGGLSAEDEAAVKNPASWKVNSDSTQSHGGSNMGVIGATYHVPLDAKSYLKTTVAVMAQEVFQQDDQLSKDLPATRTAEENYLQGRLSLASVYSRSFSRSVYLKAGFQASQLFYDLRYDTITPEQNFRKVIDGEGSTLLLEPYFQWQLTPSPRWTLNLGMNLNYFGLTQSISPEPRLSVRYDLGKNQSAGLAYGLHSMHVPLGSYFIEINGAQPNLDLDLIKAHHFVLSYDLVFASQFRLHSELYYQHLFDVPAGTGAPQTYWLLNTIEGYGSKALASGGKGNNYGLDVILEKFFRKGAFFLLSSSIFNSTFQPLDGKTYDTQYNSRFVGSFTAGKEWEFKKRNSSFQIGMRTMYNHGMPSMPLLNSAAQTTKPVYDESRPFSERAPAYFRIDGWIAFPASSRRPTRQRTVRKG